MPDAATTTTYLTAVLAGLNVVLTRSTQKMARAAERQVVAATGQAEAAKTQVEAAHRPVLVPFQLSGEVVRFRGGEIPVGGGPHVVENPLDREDLPVYSATFLPVRNVGVGPALNVRGTYHGPGGSGKVQFPTEAVAVGERGVVQFESRTADHRLSYTGNDSEILAVVEYDDVAGRTYRTRVRFAIGNNAYTSSLEADAAVPAPVAARRRWWRGGIAAGTTGPTTA